MRQSGYTGSHAAKSATGRAVRKAPSRPPSGKKRSETARIQARKRPKAAPQRQRRAAPPRPLPRRRRRRPSRRLIFFLAAVMAALLLGLTAALLLRPAGEGAYENNMDRAELAYQSGDYDRALRYLRQAASYDNTQECRLLMASCYERQEMFDKALEVLRTLDMDQPEVADRIRTLTERRDQKNHANTLHVLGVSVRQDTGELTLDGRNLQDSDLEEILPLYALESLSLANNQLSDISTLTKLGGLSRLNLSGNRIRDLSPLGQMTGLRSLNLDNNPITDLTPLYELRNLNMLSIKGLNIGEEELSALAEALPACAIHSEASEAALSDITLGGATFSSDVTELDLSGQGLRDLSALTACQDLERLNLSGNEISDLQPLMNLRHLRALDISGNGISDLRPLIGLETLISLNAARNEVLDTSAVGAMSGLQELDLSDNPIGDFSGLSRLNNLNTLRLNNTGLNDAGLHCLESLGQLTKLSIEDNPGLSNEAFGSLESRLNDCYILHSELVYTFTIDGYPARTDQTELDLSGRGIADLKGLERLEHLESLNLSQNQISNLYSLEISASRDKLKSLNLAFNHISDISSLLELKALENLVLYGNPLESEQPLLHMSWLKRLNVGSCGFTAEQLQALRDGLPNCEIVTDDIK